MSDDIYLTLDRTLYKTVESKSSTEIQAEQIASGSLLASFNQVINSLQSGKTKFDNTENGYNLGIDNGVAKFYIGSSTKYINWDGTDLNIVGGVNISELNIPDSITANSFHVDSEGNTWWGATTIGSAVAKILKTGVGTFSNVTVTGIVNATGGYIGSATALVYESQGISTGVTGYIRGNQTDYNTGIGYFLGYSGGAYKFSIGNPNGYYLKWDGVDLIVSSKTTTTASDTLIQSNDTERTTTSISYVKVKEILVNRSINGVRIKFGLKRNVGGIANAKIYKNSVAIGTERTNDSTTIGDYQTFSEDFTGITIGDLIQIYVKTDSVPNSISVANFRIYFDEIFFTNQDPT